MKSLLLFLFAIFQTPEKIKACFYIANEHQQKVSAKVEIYHNNKLIHKTNGSFYAYITKGNYTVIITRCDSDTIHYKADRDKETWVVINTECQM